jgi:phosphatidate cytidylyltransferase
MLTRILTGVLLAPLVVWLFIDGPTLARELVLAAAAVICLLELGAMTLQAHVGDRAAALLAGVGLLGGGIAVGHVPHVAWFGLAALPTALAVLARPAPIDAAARRLFAGWGGLLYVVVPLSLAIDLARAPAPLLLHLLIVVWAGDTAAYFAGRALGRHPLHPQVSPKKTVEGAIGGLIGSIAGSIVGVLVLDLRADLLAFGLLGLGAGVVGQIGDLTESLIKRATGFKDSGRILPGHGGMLDRIDGVIFAIPVYYAYLSVAG